MKFTAHGVEHVISRDSGGQGISGWIRPKCSCGWVGTTEYAYEDYQHTNVEKQEGQHVSGTRWWEGKPHDASSIQSLTSKEQPQ